VQVRIFPEGGHWLHTDNPAGVAEAILGSLR
jgi:hypothetical protein